MQFTVYFCVESNYCTKYFMGGFALQYKYANECKFRAQKTSSNSKAEICILVHPLSLHKCSRIGEFLTQSCAALAKCNALKQFIADIITLKLPQFIYYSIRISFDNYWP